MLEIAIIYKLCLRIGAVAREKGRQAVGYQIMLILFWLGGEIGTGLLAIVILALVYGEEAEHYLFLGYVAAIIGAIVSAWLAFRIVARLPEPGSNELAERDSTLDHSGM